MRVIMVAFHRKDNNRMLLADQSDGFFEPLLDAGDIIDFPTISRAEDKLIVDEGDRSSGASVFVIHVYIISYIIQKIKKKRLSSHH